MKTYVTVTNEKGRQVKIGSPEHLEMRVTCGNGHYFSVWIHAGDGTVELIGVNGFRKEFTPFDLGHK